MHVSIGTRLGLLEYTSIYILWQRSMGVCDVIMDV